MIESGAARGTALAPGVPPAIDAGDTVRGLVAVSWHEHDVPPHAEAALDRLYHSVYSTAGMFRLDGSIAQASTFVATCDGEPVSVLLYRREGGVVTVLNGSATLAQEEIERFTAAVFARYRSVHAVVFNKVRCTARAWRYPVQRHHHGEDIVADLPPTVEEYFAGLGRNMRETIKRFQNRVRRHFPDIAFRTCVGQEAEDDDLHALYRLQRARIESKHKVSTVTDAEIARIIALVRERGLVTFATIGGRIAGGMVCWRAGDAWFMRTIAHDPQYDDYKLGTLCCYYTIGECIARGGRRFHFSPGRVLYKYRFNGVERHYDRIVLHRSRLQQWLHPRVALGVFLEGRRREANLWLLDAETREDRTARLAVKAVRCWKVLRRTAGWKARIEALRAVLAAQPAALPERPGTASAAAQQEVLMRRRSAR